ncbi:MAG: molybdenum cofactor guanylyltransferase [Euryarchaeota archaeon]|nr:molybdenum cofactor guanylyltransferase [Euryarchaeota archaeon]
MLFRRRKEGPRPGNTTAVILAGGKSERFGATKGLARLAGDPLVLWAARSASAAASRLIVVLAPDADETPWRDALGALTLIRSGPAKDAVRFIHDDVPHQGPASGVGAVLPHIKDPYVLLLSSDMPLVPPDLLLGLQERLSGHDTVLFHLEGWWQTFPSLWRRDGLEEALEVAQAEAAHSLHALVEAVDARPLGKEYFGLFGDDPTILLSIDTQGDLERAEAWLARRRG